MTTTAPTYSAAASSSGTATVTVVASVVYSAVSATDAGYALRFYGHTSNAENRVRIELDSPNDPPIDVGASDFTYEWWMRCDYADNDTSSIADARYSNIVLDRDIWGHPRGWVVGVTRRTGPILAMCFAAADTGGGWTTTYGTTDVGDDEWHHIAFTWRQSTSTLELYVDGTSQGTRTLSQTDLSYPNGERPGSGANNEYLVIGGEKHGVENFAQSEAFTGYIDEFRVSDTRRYTSAFTRPSYRFLPDADTVALFHFDDGTGTTTTDTSGVSGAENGALLVGGSPSAPAWVTSDAPIPELNASVTVTTTAPTYSAVASSTGSATVTVTTTAPSYSAVASSSGSATVTVAGAVTYDVVASSSGSATVTVTTTAPTYSAAASSTGTATVTVVGGTSDTYEVVASSTGSATVTVAGAVSYDAAASSTGTATTTVAGAVEYSAVASSTGSATVTVTTTAPTYSAAASSTGSATVSVAGGVGDTYEIVASSTGSAIVTVTTTEPTYSVVASSTGSATVTVSGAVLYEVIASATGSAAVAITVAALVYSASASSTGSATVTVTPDGLTPTYYGASTTPTRTTYASTPAQTVYTTTPEKVI